MAEAAKEPRDFPGEKKTLHEGGVRGPGILVWPEAVQEPKITSMPASTSDYFPTIISALNLSPENNVEPIDGVDLTPLIKGEMTERPRPIGFQDKHGGLTLIDNRYKIHHYAKNGETITELYDLVEDREESNDISTDNPDVVSEMVAFLTAWKSSCSASAQGADYVPSYAGNSRKVHGREVYFPRYGNRRPKRYNLLGRPIRKNTPGETVNIEKSGKVIRKRAVSDNKKITVFCDFVVGISSSE